MHIPDGYLGLQTTLPALGGMVPIWGVAAKRLRKTVDDRRLPLLSLCAAFSFLIMMFNVPVGASSAHAVGAVLIAIMLGPWASCVAVSAALLIQALVFGDGGVLAYGVNCLNMAVVMPFSGWAVYRRGGARGTIAAFVGSYFGINLAAFCAAVEFGIQPLLFRAADGSPLYGVYPLSVSIPAMLLPHLLVAGVVEGVVTVGAVAVISKLSPGLLPEAGALPAPRKTGSLRLREYRPLLLVMAALAVLTPLGLLAQGTAWGEWSAVELAAMVGSVPQGFARFSDLWRAALPDYTVAGLQSGFWRSAAGYIICAVAGSALIALLLGMMTLLLRRAHKKAGVKS